MKNVLFLLMIAPVVMITGCSSDHQGFQQGSDLVNTEQEELQQRNDQAYSPSSIHSDFPIPKQAIKTNHRSNNPKITYFRYAFRGLMDVKKREQYFAEIQRWGWKEKKEEQMGSMHVFEKGAERIHLTVHSDFFTLFTKGEAHDLE